MDSVEVLVEPDVDALNDVDRGSRASLDLGVSRRLVDDDLAVRR